MKALTITESRRQVVSFALTVLLLALMLLAVEFGLRASGFVLTFPLPVAY